MALRCRRESDEQAYDLVKPQESGRHHPKESPWVCGLRTWEPREGADRVHAPGPAGQAEAMQRTAGGDDRGEAGPA